MVAEQHGNLVILVIPDTWSRMYSDYLLWCSSCNQILESGLFLLYLFWHIILGQHN